MRKNTQQRREGKTSTAIDLEGTGKSYQASKRKTLFAAYATLIVALPPQEDDYQDKKCMYAQKRAKEIGTR